ncbi:hypothetical protein PENSOL_c059G00330 [Penicillium solitum]|uniref:Uncharacterized protein n=1 Tax=Penicillium solitum TaxID=60172 RepID=A0A1V6QM22_9EURO|nr:uncharacterized protein PENSOL_c059G00330 [Penicillium solitum]OQD90270.1 hypothetical protein PENSOL_c059G00330 [Penicillium solitum]
MTSQIDYFTDLEGTEITLDAVTEAPLHIPAQTWVIVEKLREDPWRLTRKDVSDGMGVSYTSAKFLCHPAGPGNETKLAFMRIRQQVPIAGTEFKPTLRASQAVEEPENKELNALKFFLIHGCEVVPRLLGYQQSKQKEDDMVPGGFVTYIVWEKVPSDSFDLIKFWLRPFNEREVIRDKFRQVFTRFVKFGFMPLPATSSKIIYDESSGQMHISGFTFAYRLDEPQEFKDRFFYQFQLALPDGHPGALIPGIEKNNADWREDENGWLW